MRVPRKLVRGRLKKTVSSPYQFVFVVLPILAKELRQGPGLGSYFALLRKSGGGHGARFQMLGQSTVGSAFPNVALG